jgi:hypothetical protein
MVSIMFPSIFLKLFLFVNIFCIFTSLFFFSGPGNQSNTTNLQERVGSLQQEAIGLYNKGKYNDSEQQFRSLLSYLQTVYPSNHPECIKVEKSILMVQRKAQLPR